MKNLLTILFVFAASVGFSQSKSSLNLVAMFGQANWQTNEYAQFLELSKEPGKNYTFGIMGKSYLTKTKYLSLDYGFLNQYSEFRSEAEYKYPDTDFTYINTSRNKLQALTVLLPLKVNGHLGSWNVFGGFIPTYHLSANINQKSTFVNINDNQDNHESEFNSRHCNALLSDCFTDKKFALLKDFSFQYSFGIGYQIKRINFFLEFSDFLVARELGQSFDDALIDVAFFAPNLGSFGSSFSLGTSVRLH